MNSDEIYIHSAYSATLGPCTSQHFVLTISHKMSYVPIQFLKQHIVWPGKDTGTQKRKIPPKAIKPIFWKEHDILIILRPRFFLCCLQNVLIFKICLFYIKKTFFCVLSKTKKSRDSKIRDLKYDDNVIRQFHE